MNIKNIILGQIYSYEEFQIKDGISIVIKILKFLILLLVVFVSCEEPEDESIKDTPRDQERTNGPADKDLFIYCECEYDSDEDFIYFNTDTLLIRPCSYQDEICLDGSGKLTLQRDSTYSIYYNFSIIKKGDSIPLKIIKKYEEGRFSYSAHYQLEYYTYCEPMYCITIEPGRYGEIHFQPFSGESWSYNIISGLSSILIIEEEGGSLWLPFSDCYHFY